MLRSKICAEVDFCVEKIVYKIREAQTEKLPFALVVGDNEVEAGAVNVRRYGKKKSETLSLEDFKAMVVGEIEAKSRKE